MSNIIELNVTEIDTVVGGASAIQTATALARPTAPTTTGQVTMSASSIDINAMLARLEMKR